MDTFKIAVVGTGYVGMAAALALARDNRSLTCIGMANHGPGDTDTRSTALFPESVTLLEELGVWSHCRAETRPLAGIRIVDETGNLLRAPEITFRASDVGLEALAVNVPNKALHRAMVQALRTNPHLDVMPGGLASTVSHRQNGIEVVTAGGATSIFDVLVAADGLNSITRRAAAIETRNWSYEQTALALCVTHSAPHNNISTEFHRRAGPLTTVPGPDSADGHTSHLVWIETPAGAERLAGLGNDAFIAHLEEQLQGLLGHVRSTGQIRLFPIRGQTARTFAKKNTFLAGEASHVMPPIGAQGMNLGFRDVCGLVRCLETLQKNSDVAAAEAAFNTDRRHDVWMRTTAVDLLNRSLTTPYWPVRAMRGAGLHVLGAFPSLKRATIRAGFGH